MTTKAKSSKYAGKWLIDPETGEMVQVLDELGREIPDPTPMEPPLGYIKQPSLQDQIRMMVLSEKLRLEVESAGAETFEEADDFDVGDDYDPHSPWENEFDPDYSEIRSEVERLRAKGVQVPEEVDQVLNPPKETVRQDPQPKAEDVKAKDSQPKGAD